MAKLWIWEFVVEAICLDKYQVIYLDISIYINIFPRAF